MNTTFSPDDNRRALQARTGWSLEETTELCNTYNTMLELEADGLLGRSKAAGQTSKATLVRAFMLETGRSKGSVESKLMNIPAALQEHGRPMVTGYKPLENMSHSTREAVAEYWGLDS